MPEIKLKRKLIYAGDAHRAILEADPKLAYCIERIKAVDAEEVVRCQDCKFIEDKTEDGWLWCGKWNDTSECDGYCHRGERKGNA